MWNYRVVKHTSKINGRKHTWYDIREVYYNSKGKIRSWTLDAMSPGGDKKDEVLKDLIYMLMAFDRSVLKMSELNKLVRRKKNGI
jgi:hypothetical protein